MGAIEFEATLSWQSAEDTPPHLPGLDAVARRIAVTEGKQSGTRRIEGEIRAFSQAELALALESVLREVTTFAALTEAVLEVGAVRSVPPNVASPRALEELARDLWDAGFGVRFGPSWTPAPASDVCVGGGGDLRAFLRAHPAWSVA